MAVASSYTFEQVRLAWGCVVVAGRPAQGVRQPNSHWAIGEAVLPLGAFIGVPFLCLSCFCRQPSSQANLRQQLALQQPRARKLLCTVSAHLLLLQHLWGNGSRVW